MKTIKVKIKSGFTLVEVLVATVILVIVIGGFASVETANIKTGTSSKYTIQANALDQQDMNIVKSIIDKVKLDNNNANVYAGGANSECTDPGNTTAPSPGVKTSCPTGLYYIDGNNKLLTCPTGTNYQGTDNQVLLTSGSGSGKTVCEYPGPSASSSDHGALKVIDGKTFYRSVELK